MRSRRLSLALATLVAVSSACSGSPGAPSSTAGSPHSVSNAQVTVQYSLDIDPAPNATVVPGQTYSITVTCSTATPTDGYLLTLFFDLLAPDGQELVTKIIDLGDVNRGIPLSRCQAGVASTVVTGRLPFSPRVNTIDQIRARTWLIPASVTTAPTTTPDVIAFVRTNWTVRSN